MTDYTVKDSGEREEYASGMRRDVQTDKPRIDLVTPLGLPYQETMAYRRGMHMMRGADKYGDRNWELASSHEELLRFRASAARHFLQWFTGETDEDHAAAVQFNMDAAELVNWKLDQGQVTGSAAVMTPEDVEEFLSRWRDDIVPKHGEPVYLEYPKIGTEAEQLEIPFDDGDGEGEDGDYLCRCC